MAVIIDTSFIIAYLIKSDKYHKRAVELFNSFTKKEFGSLYITDYVLDEVLTVLWVKTKRKDIVEQAYSFLSDVTGIFKLLMLTPIMLESTWEVWKKYAEYPKRPLSFIDCSLLTIAQEYSIKYIASFDDEFNGLISVLS